LKKKKIDIGDHEIWLISHYQSIFLVEEEEDDMFGASLRGVFIIDPSQKIR